MYTSSEKNVDRKKEIEDQQNDRHLTVVICDEAHFGATGKTDDQDRETPYSLLLNHYNSEDFPRVIVIMVTATPWSLLTTYSRIELTKVFRNHDGNLEKIPKNTLSVLENGISLNRITWNETLQATLFHGKSYRLMILQENLNYEWLETCTRQSEDAGVEFFPEVSRTMSNAKPTCHFKICGDMSKYVRISTMIEGKEHFLTVCGKNLNLMDFREKHTQEFCISFLYGNDIFTLRPKLDKKSKIVGLLPGQKRLRLLDSRLGDASVKLPDCYEAPLNSSFLMFPETDDVIHYLSLNRIINSVRFPEDQKLLRVDDQFTELLNSWEDKHSEVDVQISDYCLAILLRKHLIPLAKVKSTTIEDHEKRMQLAIKSIADFVRIIDDFSFDPRPITKESFTKYLKICRQIVDPDTGDESVLPYHMVFVYDVLTEYLGRSDVLYHDQNISHISFSNRKFKDVFAATSLIIDEILKPYNDEKTSGHLAIIRVNTIRDANRFKQSLCIARFVAKLHKLEVIQDYGDKTTLTRLERAMQRAERDAKIFGRESLLIKRRIQTEKCQKVNSKGRRLCECEDYQPLDEESLTCVFCKHIHKEFSGYEDLLGLPAILLLVQNGKMGDTFPKESFRILDDRINNWNKVGKVYLTTFAQEKGRLCRYTSLNKDQPIAFIGAGLYEQLKNGLKKDATYYRSFVDRGQIDLHLTFDKNGQLVPKDGHTDSRIDHDLPRDNHYMVSAEPQCGKTTAFLDVISMLSNRIAGENYIEYDDDDDTSDEEESDEYPEYHEFEARIPYWKDLIGKSVPKTTTPAKYTRFTGPFVYESDMKGPILPDFKAKVKTENQRRKKDPEPNHDLLTYNWRHSCQLCNNEVVAKKYTFAISEFVKDKRLRITFPDKPHYHVITKPSGEPEVPTIMTPSFDAARHARLNYTHLFRTGGNQVAPFLHFVFVRSYEFEEYSAFWRHQVAIVELPKTMNDIEENVEQGGIGYARRFIQRFAYRFNFNQFYFADDTIIYFQKGKVGRNGMVLRDSQNYIKMVPASLIEITNGIKEIGSADTFVPNCIEFEAHENFSQSRKIQAYSGPKSGFGIIGLRKYRLKRPQVNLFNKSHCQSFFYIVNNDSLVENNILFNPWQAWEDLCFSNDVDSKTDKHVAKLQFYEFRKIHGRDSLKLYTWSENEKVPLTKNIDTKYRNDDKVKSVMKNFLKSLRIKSIQSTYKTNPFKEILSATKLFIYGAKVMILRNIEEIELDASENSNIVIVPFSNLFSGKNYTSIVKYVQKKIPKKLAVISISSTHKPRMIGDFVVIEIQRIGQKRTSTGDVKQSTIQIKPETSKEQDKLEEDEGPTVKFYYPKKTQWAPNMFEKAYMEKKGQISLKNIQDETTYETNHILVHVISRPWGGSAKVSIKVEDIREPMQRIMFYWPRNPCPDLKKMKPNWIYRVTNFKVHRYDSSIVSGGLQIELHENSRIEPMPPNLDIRIPFNPKPIDVRLLADPDSPRFVDTVARVIRVIHYNPGFDLIVKNEMNTKYGYEFRIDCTNSSKRDGEIAEKFVGRTIMVRNAFYPKEDPQYKVVVVKDFVALRLEDDKALGLPLSQFKSKNKMKIATKPLQN